MLRTGGLVMSRIGKAPIEIPSGVDITLNDDNTVVVKVKTVF